jgi:branched-chain amino acid transport system permease protein
MAQAWNILGGYAGQTSIGHALFFGLGAYTSTLASTSLGLNPWLGGILAIVVATCGPVDWLALLSFEESLLRHRYFGGCRVGLFDLFAMGTCWGCHRLAASDSILRTFNFQYGRDKTGYYYIALALVSVVTLIVVALVRSKIGYVLQAIRDDEEAAQSLGFSPRLYKLVAMAFSAGILGFCGTFYAQYVLLIDPPSVLATSISIAVALMSIFGGIGTVPGPILGSVVLVTASEYSRVYFSGSGCNLDLMIYGALVTLIAVYRPNGIIGLFARLRMRRARS